MQRMLWWAAGGLLLFAAPVAVWAVPDTVRIPKANPHPEGTPAPAALFSHWAHSNNRCFACHPSVFPQAAVSFTHVDMNEGRYCGRCHGNGAAPAVLSYRCEQCHVPQ